MANKVWDISPYISPASPVWPGDTTFSQTDVWTLDEDCPVNVAKFTMSAHTGAHADAPRHYDKDGLYIGDVSLEYYLGACTVVDVRSITQATIDLSSIKSLLPSRLAPRVLFRTYERAPQTAWDSHFKAVSPELIEFLANQGVKLIGTDTPSLDPQESKTMDAHKMIAKYNMAILEGLVLDDVAADDYELIALPLKFKYLDASPVRAVLRELL